MAAVRFRLYPTASQESGLVEHCAHARFVWNLGLEQRNLYRPGRPTPRFVEQSRQLTEARDSSEWLAAGSRVIQEQALRDLDQAMRNWWKGTHRRPTWRKKGINEGFRVVDKQAARPRRVNRRWSVVLVPKVGWVRFRRSRAVPDAKSYRVTRDPSGRWHIAFAVIPDPIGGPGNGSIVGIDRGVAVTVALSDGTTYRAPHDRSAKRLQRQLARAEKDSNRRSRIRLHLARAQARNADRRKDWIEKASTDIARRYDLICIEDLRIKNMTRSARGTAENPGRNVRAKAGLNGAILAQGWGIFAHRLQEKARGRVEKINPAYTSQTCSACGHVDVNSRESQAKFVCTACGYADNADVNAAKNIAAGHAVTARRGLGVVDLPSKREPQLELVS